MPRCRPFKLVDAMILVAAAAAWMALMRIRWVQLQGVWAVFNKFRPPPWQHYLWLAQWSLVLFLCVLTLAYLAMRLVPPRPPRPHLIRQPGMLLVGFMIGCVMLLMLVSVFVSPVSWMNVLIALALGLAWGVACRCHRSCAEPGWIEGLGRFAGVGWIVSTAASYPLHLLMYGG